MPSSEPLLPPVASAGQSSTAASAVVLFKTVVGTGVFALPPAIRACGWLLGSVMVLLLAFISVYTMGLVIACIRVLRERQGPSPSKQVEFQDMTAAAFSGGFVNGLIMLVCVLGQVGSIIGFMAFVASNVMSLSDAIERWHVLLSMTLFLAPLSLLRTTSHPAFSGAMVFGNVALILALGTVVVYGFTEQGLRPLPTAADPSGIGLAFGVCIFMFTGYMEVVSIEQDMRERGSFYRMMVLTFVGVTALYLTFGLLVYSFFGEATGRTWHDGAWEDATILQNLEGGGAILGAVKLAFSANLCFMSPMVLLPASKAVEDALGVAADDRQRSGAVRLALVFGMGAAALVLPGFEVITAVIGCLTGVTAFSVPALCYLRFLAGDLSLAHRAWLWFVVWFGILGTVYSLAQLAQ